MKLFVLSFLIGCIACGSRDCNVLKVEFSGQVAMNKNALVIIEGGIAGHVEDVDYKDGVTRMELCLQDATSISKNSTVEAGFVPIYGGRCVLIRPSSDFQDLADDELLNGVDKDTLAINLPQENDADKVLKKKAVEMLREQNRKDSLEHKK